MWSPALRSARLEIPVSYERSRHVAAIMATLGPSAFSSCAQPGMKPDSLNLGSYMRCELRPAPDDTLSGNATSATLIRTRVRPMAQRAAPRRCQATLSGPLEHDPNSDTIKKKAVSQ